MDFDTARQFASEFRNSRTAEFIKQILRLRSGFRRGLRRRAKRLNLLKKILASTLGVFQKVSRQARLADSTGRGGCMGRSSAIVRLAFIFIIVVSIAALTSCSSSSPTTNTTFPVPANITLSPANTVSLDVGSATQSSPPPRKTARTRRDHDSGHLPFQQYRGPDHIQQWAGLRRHLGFASRAANLHSRTGRSGPGHRHVARSKQPAHHCLRASAHRQDRGQPVPGQTPPTGPCFSKGQIFNYQATAFSRGLDITASVGPFTWQADQYRVATVGGRHRRARRWPDCDRTGYSHGAHSGNHVSVCQHQQRNQSASGFHHLRRCNRSRSTVAGSATNSVNVTSGSGKTVTATVVDTQGNTITGVRPGVRPTRAQ